MALSWSFDKLGPICRTVEDAALVLTAINGSDPGDPASVDRPFAFDAGGSIEGLHLGYAPEWFEQEVAHDLDRRVLEVLADLGVRLTEVTLPDLPYDALGLLIGVESAAAFEELTLSGRDDLLARQGIDAWPNKFRRNRLVPAVEYVQVQRFRRVVMNSMAEAMAGVDGLISPSFAGPLLLVTNCTGHPSLTLPVGLKDDGTPHGITLWGKLYDEGTLCRIGVNLERELDVCRLRPPLGKSGE
jgi:Asp-tRNA(Asn)/Glu-tRNA(Gln) amidotransferase A subunit family amidase